MKKRQDLKIKRSATTTAQLPAPGLRAAMMLIVALALVVGFATAKAQPADGAAAVAESDWGLALHANGQISTHAIAEIFANGTIPVEDKLLAFSTFSP